MYPYQPDRNAPERVSLTAQAAGGLQALNSILPKVPSCQPSLVTLGNFHRYRYAGQYSTACHCRIVCQYYTLCQHCRSVPSTLETLLLSPSVSRLNPDRFLYYRYIPTVRDMSDTSLDTMPQSLPGASFDAYNSVEGFTAYFQEQARTVSEL